MFELKRSMKDAKHVDIPVRSHTVGNTVVAIEENAHVGVDTCEPMTGKRMLVEYLGLVENPLCRGVCGRQVIRCDVCVYFLEPALRL